MKKKSFYQSPETKLIMVHCESMVCESCFSGSVNESVNPTEETTDDIIFGW